MLSGARIGRHVFGVTTHGWGSRVAHRDQAIADLQARLRADSDKAYVPKLWADLRQFQDGNIRHNPAGGLCQAMVRGVTRVWRTHRRPWITLTAEDSLN